MLVICGTKAKDCRLRDRIGGVVAQKSRSIPIYGGTTGVGWSGVGHLSARMEAGLVITQLSRAYISWP
jgi:hypothetical protein